uniref:Uncharacterized protein n=1 Tax=Geospiza parvula TaxID=87175 RepID=A0A8C3MMA8_GEOPR
SMLHIYLILRISDTSNGLLTQDTATAGYFNSGKMLTDRNESWLSNFSSAASSFARGGVGLQEVLVGLVLTLIDVVTLLGNTVVFLCPVVEKRLRTVTYMFIMSLAMADFLVACLVMPFSPGLTVIIYEVTGMWLFGKLFCKVWISFDVMFCTASIVTLCFISLDRYCSVVTPYHYSRRISSLLSASLSFCRCIVMTCTVWVYSSLISFLPVMQGWNEIPGVDFDAGRECIFVTNWVFAIVASALAFFLPFMVMCSMYFFIYRASRLKATRIMSQTLEIHYHPNSKRQNHLQLENKATRTISIIISVFVLCWLPYFVLNVWLAARGSDSTSTVLLGTFKIITCFLSQSFITDLTSFNNSTCASLCMGIRGGMCSLPKEAPLCSLGCCSGFSSLASATPGYSELSVAFCELSVGFLQEHCSFKAISG